MESLRSMITNEDKKKCKGGRKKGFLATIAALLLSCSVVLAQNYTAGVTNTDKPDLSMQKVVYRLQILETNMLAMTSGTNTMIITNATFGDMTNLLACIKTNTAIVDRNVTNTVNVTNVIFGDITNLLAYIRTNSDIFDRNITNVVEVTNSTFADVTNLLSVINTNTTPSYGTNGTSVVFADGLETNVFMPFTATGGDGATLPMAVAPMLFDGVGALNRDQGVRSVTNVVTVTNIVFADIPTLLALFQKYHETNGTYSATNSLKTVPLNYDYTSGSAKVKETTPILSQTWGADGTGLMINAVSTNYTSEWIDSSAYNAFSFQISTPAAQTTNEVIYIDGTLNSGTNWFVLSTNTMATTNSVLVQLEGKIQKLRARQLSTGTVFSVEAFLGYK